MLKRAIRPTANLGILLTLACLGVWAEPGLSQKRHETPETLANRLAEQRFQEYGFPVIVRQDDHIAGCTSLNEDGGAVQVASEEVLTEFVYGARWVCASVYTQAGPTEPTGRLRRFEPGGAYRIFGSVSGRAFLERKRLGFRFRGNPGDEPDQDAVREFAAKLPKILNIRRAGTLATAVTHFKTDAEPGHNAEAAPARPAPERALPSHGSTWPWKTLFLVSLVALLAVAAFLFYSRFQLRTPAHAPAEPAAKTPGAERPRATQPPDSLRRAINYRQAFAFAVNNARDQRNALAIDTLLSELPKHGVNVEQLNEMVAVARKIHAWAVKDDLSCPLELVRFYLVGKLEEKKREERAG
jgi:hypothetical protein